MALTKEQIFANMKTEILRRTPSKTPPKPSDKDVFAGLLSKLKQKQASKEESSTQ